MCNDDSFDKAKKGVEIIGQIIKAAGNNQNIKDASNELGKTAVTLTKTINNALLPLAAVNFAFEKARIYFNESFKNDITEKTKNIDQEHLIEPKASIAGPALQALAFSFEDKDLKEMYLNLLASSMDSSTSDNAHPAFVEIIRQLSTEEAELLKDIFSTKLPSLPIVQLRDIVSSRSYTVVQAYVLNITDESTGEPICNPNISNMIENLIRLGLLKAEFGVEVGIPNSYEWADSRPEIEIIKQNNSKVVNIHNIKGILSITGLGWRFAESVGLYAYYT